MSTKEEEREGAKKVKGESEEGRNHNEPIRKEGNHLDQMNQTM